MKEGSREYDEMRRRLENLGAEPVVFGYDSTVPGCTTYLIVTEVVDGRVGGEMVTSPGRVNSISIDELLKKDNLQIAEFKRL